MNYIKFVPEDLEGMDLEDLEGRLSTVREIIAIESKIARDAESAGEDPRDAWEIVTDYRREQRALIRAIARF